MDFINAKNNLSSYGDMNMKQMEEVGSTAQVNMVVEMGKVGKGAQRYLIAKSDKPGQIVSPVLQDLGKVDMGDWKHLVEFGKWTKATFPAKHYMLIVWNHGSGWLNQEQKEAGAKGISYDDETGNHMTTQQLASAVAEIGNIDVYGSDACLMQMAEVAYEMKDHAKVIVGSEETEPGDGWNYKYFLGPVVQNPGMSPEQMGQNAVEAYKKYYAEGNRGATQSALQADKLKQLVPLVNSWTQAVMNANEKEVLKGARSSVQHFAYSDNIDLVHFVQLINAKTQDQSVKSSGEQLMKFVQEKMLLSNGATGGGYANAMGMAVYLPRYSVSADYAKLAWAKESNWAEFAAWFVKNVKATQEAGVLEPANKG
jgi:hypothetical protein